MVPQPLSVFALWAVFFRITDMPLALCDVIRRLGIVLGRLAFPVAVPLSISIIGKTVRWA